MRRYRETQGRVRRIDRRPAEDRPASECGASSTGCRKIVLIDAAAEDGPRIKLRRLIRRIDLRVRGDEDLRKPELFAFDFSRCW